MAFLTCFLTFALILTGFLVLLKIYLKLKTTWCNTKTCLVGKTVLVTGSNTGMGYEAALEFAKRGARVILACRECANEIPPTQARDKIMNETGNRNVLVKLVDFSSFKSVRSFAKDILETEERIDVLVNNAGLQDPRNKVTEDGLQFLTQVNFFGPFLLTLLLIDKLKKSAPSRIVNVSSIMAAHSKLDVNNLNAHVRFYSYQNSKLCGVLFTMHLAKLLEKHNISVFSVHPGAVDTGLNKGLRGLMRCIGDIAKPFMKTAEEGAQTAIYVATQQGIEHLTGRHFSECQVVNTYATASDPDLPKQLWDKTVELLKCEEEVKTL